MTLRDNLSRAGSRRRRSLLGVQSFGYLVQTGVNTLHALTELPKVGSLASQLLSLESDIFMSWVGDGCCWIHIRPDCFVRTG